MDSIDMMLAMALGNFWSMPKWMQDILVDTAQLTFFIGSNDALIAEAA